MFLKIRKNFFELASLFSVSIGIYIFWKKYFLSNVKETKSHFPKDFKIYYSTETGNSRCISELLKKSLNEIGVDATVSEINSIFYEDIHLFKENTVLVFVLSTCGNGSFPATSRKFIKFLIKMVKLNKKIFKDVKYTVIGLGSSIYDCTYNIAAIKLDGYISTLGGVRYCEIAMLDEVNGNEIELNLWWNDKLLKKIGRIDIKKFTRVKSINSFAKNDYICLLKRKNEILNNSYSYKGECHTSEKYFRLTEFRSSSRSLLCESSINNEYKKNIFNLKLESLYGLEYNTFDIIDILPPNPIDVVLFFSNKLFDIPDVNELDNIIIDFKSVDAEKTTLQVPFPSSYSLKHVLTYFFDLITLPDLEVISQFFPYIDADEVITITKDDFLSKYRSYKYSLSMFIDKFMKSLRSIPIEEFLKFHGMRQIFRSYSISSSSLCSPSKIELTINTYLEGPIEIEDLFNESGASCKSNQKKYFKGLCSNYLFEFNTKSSIYGLVRPSSFKLNDINRSMLLFSHGSGIAPIRALLYERNHLIDKNGFTKKTHAYLFYGCRTIDEIPYQNELEMFKVSGALTDSYFAFSKSHKKHVKDIISLHKNPIIKTINDWDSIIYICGRKEFASGIRRELASIFLERYSNNDLYKNMYKEGRIIVETWN